MILYWVTTEDHDEDWFIVANNPEEAAEFYEDEEGYDPGDAYAEEVLEIPANCQAEIGWPSNELLISLGAKFISSSTPRIVEIHNKKYCEGLLEGTIRELDDDMFEKCGKGRLNKTKKIKLD